jgi:long-chain fatty acid transport protein
MKTSKYGYSSQNRGLPRLILLSLGLALIISTDADAVGFRLPNQDPEAIARGNAFVATADNPSAIYYNPAGITQLEGQNLRVGMYFVSAGVDYTSPSGAKAKVNSDFQPVPQIYYVFSPKNSDFSFGVGIYAPYGLALDWGNNAPFRTLAENGKVLYATINPVIAWRVHPTLSIGIGPTINYSEATLQHGIGLIPGDSFKFTGSGVAFGFNAGVRWQPAKQWAFGASYHSETTVEYQGQSATSPSPPFPASTSTHGSLVYPQFVIAGVSFRPTENWNLEFDIDWTDWDSVKQVVFKGTAFGDIPFAFNYRSSFMYEFGVTRQLGKGYFVSVGYFFSENSSPDKNFNPIVPDSDLHLGSLGFGHRGKRWDWAAAYHFGYNEERVVSGSQPGLADGKYSTLNHGFNLSMTLKF